MPLAHDIPASSPTPEPNATQVSTTESGVDLSVLKNISFGPDWSATPSTEALVRKVGSRGLGKRSEHSRDFGSGPVARDGPARRDRRPTRPAEPGFAPPAGGSRPPLPGQRPDGPPRERPRFPTGGETGPRYGRPERRQSPPPFQPTLEVLFYPDDAAFRALTKAIRASCRTYELFEVARLILQKPERFVVVFKSRPSPDGPPAPLYVAQPDRLPFETEEQAIDHVFQNHLDKFCVVEEVEIEAPKGNFVGVSRCGFTGELLGPPNYHRYQQLLREHHARRLKRVPFDKFTARLELVKEPEQIAAWLEKMKKSTRYKLKDAIEGAPEFFESLDSARQFLLGHKKDAIVRAFDTTRYPGRMIEQFAPGDIRRSIETVLDHQRHFPLETANNLRGRLRRMKFNLYKKGAKGVSYVCAVKRKFRDPQTVLAEPVQQLIAFLEKNPLTPASRLPYDFLGLPKPAQTPPPFPASAPESGPTASAPATAAVETASAQPEPAVVASDPASPALAAEAPTAELDPSSKASATEETQNSQLETVSPSLDASAKASAAEEAQNPPSFAEASEGKKLETPISKPETISPKLVSSLSPEQQSRLRDLLLNLRWLVTEGYVVEYGDGRLYAPPPLPPSKPKAAGEASAASPASEDWIEVEDSDISSDAQDFEETHFNDEPAPAAADAPAPPAAETAGVPASEPVGESAIEVSPAPAAESPAPISAEPSPATPTEPSPA
jgi:hypothetical protein